MNIKNIGLWVLTLLITNFVVAQEDTYKPDDIRNTYRSRSIVPNLKSLPINPLLQPFYHGVASGDPSANSVIIWTRVTPDSGLATTPIDVQWRMATDTALTNVIKSGTVKAQESRDFTVKIDVTGLQPATTYYYGFIALGKASLTGRTRTAPDAGASQLRFAVVSCQNYEAGFYNAFARIADRNDLDAVIHLGDYIYEYPKGTYGAGLSNRVNQPDKEIIELADYRTRYSLYRLDADLMRAHQQHPFITVWDDHESANDAYKDGAQNHQSNEGDWATRKAISKKVYSEWMPIRDQQGAEQIYRTIKYGNLAELFMLDTRLEARDKQGTQFNGADVLDVNRTMIGNVQKQTLLSFLDNSTATWKILGNQVMFGQLNVGFSAGFMDGSPDITNIDSISAVENIFLDIWDGYPAERDAILAFIEQFKINNTIIISGDIHSSFANDITRQPVDYPNPLAANLPTPNSKYNPATGAGSLAVEFVTPSITSANFDENVGMLAATVFQQNINRPLNVGPPLGTVNYNPHMKYVDLIKHGYMILNLKPDTAQADYFYVEKILEPNANEAFGAGPYTVKDANHLKLNNTPSTGKAVQEIPAPLLPPSLLTSLPKVNNAAVVALQLYPNPANSFAVMSYNLNEAGDTRISIIDISGKEIMELQPLSRLNKGIYTLEFDTRSLPNGLYIINISHPKGSGYAKLQVSR